MSRGGKGKKEVTVGYWYGLGFHAVFCHGPVTSINEIIVGEKTAWSGTATSNTDIAIDRLDLFGGEGREGGVRGTARLRFGAASQPKDAYLQSKLGAEIPAFRGVVSLIWNGLVAANNPYIKPWSIKARRIPDVWYQAKAAIGDDANPAHIIYECLTNRTWGLGYTEGDIDTGSFTAAANRLYSEGFGLSIIWGQETSLEDFLGVIMRHIDGALYIHPQTGKFVLRLVRDDYVKSDLPLFDPSNVVEATEFSRPTLAELVNQVVLTYVDGASQKPAAITVQNLALIASQRGIVSATVHMPGISSPTLAARVAERELRARGTPMAKISIVADRHASRLMPGDPFRFSWPEWGIEDVVFRVARIAYGNARDYSVRIDAVQDIFALPTASFAASPSSQWTNPISAPAPCPAQMLYEVPYYQVVVDLVGEWPSLLNDIDASEGVVAAIGVRPSQDAFNFHAMLLDGSQWVDGGRGTFSAYGVLTANMPQTSADTSVSVGSGVDIYDVMSGDFAIIDDEWMQVISVSGSTITFARGVLDTVPAAHSTGAAVYFLTPHYIDATFTAGQTVTVRLLPKTGKGELAINAATSITRIIKQRFIRPYPPGNIKINNTAYPVAINGDQDITISWANRNRVTQTAGVVKQTDGNITPEAGQTTTIRIYGGASLTTLRRTYSDLTGTSQTWTLADIASDGATNDGRIRLEIESKRTDSNGTFTSLYKHDIAFDRAGYGMRWGEYYGGV